MRRKERTQTEYFDTYDLHTEARITYAGYFGVNSEKICSFRRNGYNEASSG